MIKHELLKVSELKAFPIREIRENILDKLRERIKERGYNQAKSLTVVQKDDGYFVVDGNHRLQVLQENKIETVPCVIYDGEGDEYNLAVQANVDEDTYAPMDLFDWLDVIRKLNGFTQEEIGQKLGWDRGKVNHYKRVLMIDTKTLIKCKGAQIGRVSENDTNGSFNFTERWFRDSGLYNLCPKYTEKLIVEFIKYGCFWNKAKVQSESAKYKQWQSFIKIAEDELVNQDDLPLIIELIENNTFKTEEQLRRKIADLNKTAKNKLICGDSIIEMEKLEDASIDLVITDPPYGIDYKSNRSQFDEHVTKEGIANDGLDEALDLLDKSCEVLQRKAKQDAHFYIFTGWKVYPEFKAIIEKYFKIRNMIVWDKGNHGSGDLENTWGNRHELIIFATKGNRKINKRDADIINVSKVSSDKAIHPTQKPEALIKKLLDVSSQKADTIIDPFMGSGSTIKAIKEYGNLNYIGIELDKSRFDKAVAYIGGDSNERNE